MKCQILFSGKNKKNIINLLSAENAQRVVKVKGQFYVFSSSRHLWWNGIIFCTFFFILSTSHDT